MAIKKFRVQLVYDMDEKKLACLGNVHDKNGTLMKTVVAIAIADPSQDFPTTLLVQPSLKVVMADILCEVPDAKAKGEITIKKKKR